MEKLTAEEIVAKINSGATELNLKVTHTTKLLSLGIHVLFFIQLQVMGLVMQKQKPSPRR